MIAAALVLAGAVPSLAGECRPDAVHLRGDWGEARFAVEVADTPQERSRGLMFREKMASGAGMLFVYERPQKVSFWMRNTLIPLDMIFLDDTGTVQLVQPDARPLDETPIPGAPDTLLVLEINGGLARRLGIAPGTVLRHPAVPQDRAAWPC